MARTVRVTAVASVALLSAALLALAAFDRSRQSEFAATGPAPTADPATDAGTARAPEAVEVARADTGAVEAAVAAAAPADPVDAPLVDILRVERDGSALISGRARPGATVDIVLDGAPFGSSEADASGSFVAFLDIPRSGVPRSLALQARTTGTEAVEGPQTFIVEPRAALAEPPQPTRPEPDRTTPTPVVEMDPAPVDPATAPEASPTEATAALRDAPDAADLASAPPEAISAPSQPDATAPRVLVLDDAGLRVMQDSGAEGLSIDTISYRADGNVVLGGRAPDAAPVRVYLDDRALDTTRARPDGQWRIDLPTLDPQVYTLRVDQLDAAGNVTARAETPFRPEPPARIAELGDGLAGAGLSRVTVQPGYTLWGIAEERYGDGFAFVRVFEANAEIIRDPDLIFPGQIFDIPD